MTFTLLLTCVGGELAPQMIRILKASSGHDVKVIGVDARADAVGRHFADAFATVPRGSDSDYVDAIVDLVTQHHVDLVLPTSDEEALALAASRAELEGGDCRLACADIEVLKTVADKADCYARLAQIGVPVPDWRRAESLDDLDAAVDAMIEAHREIVVKPAALRGGRGVCVIRSDISGARVYGGGRETHMDHATFRREYVRGFAGQLPAVVMERLLEPVHDIDMLAWDGRPIRVVPRRRVDSALPNEGHTIVGNADLISLGEQLIEGFGLTWLYDCDVMYDRAGQPGILEINPRPSGSIAATIAAGVPLLDDLISLAKGEPVPEIELPVGRIVVPFKCLAVANK